ncbi:MAG: ABC transporter substrate-binding protein [Bdellovibrionales bacterium]|nr:ABC transporter substrate-binding protein [Bdellovibrionales bacterium]
MKETSQFALPLFALVFLLLVTTLLYRARPEPEHVTLGIIAPVSGDFAAYGSEIERGVALALDTLGEQGVTARVHIEDACLAKDGVNAARRLVEVEKVAAVVGNYCIASMVPNAEFFERTETPVFQSSVVPEVLLEGNRFFFSTFPSIRSEAEALAVHARETLHAETAAVLFLTTPWGESFQQTFAEAFEARGGRIVGKEQNAIGENDFRSELTRIREAEPDALLIVHLGDTLAAALKQVRALSIESALLSVDEAEEPQLLAAAGSAAEGVSIFTPHIEATTTAAQEFRVKYVNRFQQEPGILSAHSYDATMLTVKAAEACGSEGHCMADFIRKQDGYEGASGTLRFRTDGTTERTLMLKRVRNGRFAAVPAPQR